jgi:hypothetical protein
MLEEQYPRQSYGNAHKRSLSIIECESSKSKFALITKVQLKQTFAFMRGKINREGWW